MTATGGTMRPDEATMRHSSVGPRSTANCGAPSQEAMSQDRQQQTLPMARRHGQLPEILSSAEKKDT